jgi:hypothetical protein
LADFLLAADIPNIEFEGFCLDGFDVKATRWSSFGRVFVAERFEDRSFAGIVQTEKKDPAFVVGATHFLEKREKSHPTRASDGLPEKVVDIVRFVVTIETDMGVWRIVFFGCEGSIVSSYVRDVRTLKGYAFSYILL